MFLKKEVGPKVTVMWVTVIIDIGACQISSADFACQCHPVNLLW